MNRTHNNNSTAFLQLIAYALLVGVMVYAISVERHNSYQAREDLSTQTRVVLVKGCERTNQLREVLRGVLSASQVANARREQSPEAAAAAKTFYASQIARLADVNCEVVYPKSKLG